jgi:hypothetical protein
MQLWVGKGSGARSRWNPPCLVTRSPRGFGPGSGAGYGWVTSRSWRSA